MRFWSERKQAGWWFDLYSSLAQAGQPAKFFESDVSRIFNSEIAKGWPAGNESRFKAKERKR